jgi:DNA-binding HxlR family transcriptional regulator
MIESIVSDQLPTFDSLSYVDSLTRISLVINCNSVNLINSIIQTSLDVKYDTSLDTHILTFLHKNKSLSYNEFYERICDNHLVSKDAFNNHLKILIADKMLIKHDLNERGKRVWYSLSDYAKDRLEADNLSADHTKTSEKEVGIRRKMFLVLLFAEYYNNHIYESHSEKQLEKLLDTISTLDELESFPEEMVGTHLTRSECIPIKLTPIGHIFPYPPQFVNPPYKVYVTRYTDPLRGLVIWKERYETCELKCINSSNKGTNDHKVSIDKSQISRYIYRSKLLGISRKDMISKKNFAFEHVDMTINEVEEALKFMIERKILIPSYFIFGEIRYTISDDCLRSLIYDCFNLIMITEELMEYVWRNIRKPKSVERSWLASIHGHRRAEFLFTEFYLYRRKSFQLNKKDRTNNLKGMYIKARLKSVIHWRELINQIHKDTVEKHQFPLRDLLEIACPNFFIEDLIKF